jgi:hypothetical protein
MTSPQIKILVTLACISIVYAFVCHIRITQKANKLSEWIRKKRPDLWSEVPILARSWNGGQPGLKILYRKNVVGHPKFDQEYGQLQAMERNLLWGIGIGSACIGLIIIGSIYWGWRL